MSWDGGFVSFCIVLYRRGSGRQARCFTRPPPLTRMEGLSAAPVPGFNPEPLGDLTHAGAPQCRQNCDPRRPADATDWPGVVTTHYGMRLAAMASSRIGNRSIRFFTIF